MLKTKRTMAVLDPDTKAPVYNVPLDVWAKFMGDVRLRRVAETTIKDAYISTVFRGYSLDQKNFFETHVFGLPNHSITERYATWDEALAGHYNIVDKVKEILEVKNE